MAKLQQIFILIIAFSAIQMAEAIHPGFVSGPVNLGLVWVVFVAWLMAVTSATPAAPPDQPPRPSDDQQ